jgi:hypothetical protein
MLRSKRGHVVIVLQRVQPDPGKRDGSGDGIRVQWLMKVPEQGDAERGRGDGDLQEILEMGGE